MLKVILLDSIFFYNLGNSVPADPFNTKYRLDFGTIVLNFVNLSESEYKEDNKNFCVYNIKNNFHAQLCN